MSARQQQWSGSFVMDVGRALYVGPGLSAEAHAHHAMQVCVGLEEPLRVRPSARGAWAVHDGCVIAPEQSHEFDAGGRAVALLYIEPEAADGRRVAAVAARRGITALDGGIVTRIRAAMRSATTARGGSGAQTMDAAFAALGFDVGSGPTDARIRRALQSLKQCRFEYPTSADLAAELGVSPGRFRHLWLDELGLAYRRYLLWLRLRAAILATSRGLSLTEAAHEAGFADSAHLARTFRRLLGIAASAMPALQAAPTR